MFLLNLVVLRYHIRTKPLEAFRRYWHEDEDPKGCPPFPLSICPDWSDARAVQPDMGAAIAGTHKMTAPGSGFDVQPSVGNHFAWIRTLLGLQRTLMAAVRTAASLVGFGFTVAQFFQRLQGNVPDGLRMMNPETPRIVGLVLIATGVVSLAIFTWQYWSAVKYLPAAISPCSPAITRRCTPHAT